MLSFQHNKLLTSPSEFIHGDGVDEATGDVGSGGAEDNPGLERGQELGFDMRQTLTLDIQGPCW